MSSHRPPGGGAVTGEIRMWSHATPPTGWKDCNGDAISRTDYAALFALIGTTFGGGDGSTTFNLPDMRGRSPLGVGTGAGLTARALADAAGEEDHALTSSENATHGHGTGGSHSHGVTYKGPGGAITNGFQSDAVIGSQVAMTTGSTHSHNDSGSSNAHNTMHPYLAVHFIIKT